jgi:SAM-dependent methyltransferase
MLNRRTVLLSGTAATALAGALRTTVLAASAPAAASLAERGFDGWYERLPALDLESRMDFIWGVQAWQGATQSKAAQARMDQIMQRRGIAADAPVSTADAVEMFASDPLVAGFVKFYTTTQQLKFAMLTHEFHGNEELYLGELEAAAGKGPGRLELNPDLDIPAYARRELHMQPGGYVGDPFAGYVFRYAIVGLHSGHNFQDEVFAGIVTSVPTPADGRVRRILELGCGIGQMATALAQRFPEAEVWGIDSSAPMLRYAHLRATQIGARVSYSQRLGENTRFPDGHFDLVTVNGLHHEVSPAATRAIVAEVARILRPGGIYYPLDFHTAEPPRADAKSQFGAWWLHRWGHEDWKPDYAALDLRAEMRKCGLLDRDAPSHGGRAAPNMMGVKPA